MYLVFVSHSCNLDFIKYKPVHSGSQTHPLVESFKMSAPKKVYTMILIHLISGVIQISHIMEDHLIHFQCCHISQWHHISQCHHISHVCTQCIHRMKIYKTIKFAIHLHSLIHA